MPIGGRSYAEPHALDNVCELLGHHTSIMWTIMEAGIRAVACRTTVFSFYLSTGAVGVAPDSPEEEDVLFPALAGRLLSFAKASADTPRRPSP